MPRKKQSAGRKAHSVQHHSSSAEFSVITSENDVLIFYLTEPIFFHGDVIRDISKKGVRSVYKRVKTIDNDFRKPFEGVVNEVRRRNTATGDDRVTRKILKSKEGISENLLEGSG